MDSMLVLFGEPFHFLVLNAYNPNNSISSYQSYKLTQHKRLTLPNMSNNFSDLQRLKFDERHSILNTKYEKDR